MNIEEFIYTCLTSVDDLRALLLLQEDPRAEWNAEGVGAKLYRQPGVAAAVLG